MIIKLETKRSKAFHDPQTKKECWNKTELANFPVSQFYSLRVNLS